MVIDFSFQTDCGLKEIPFFPFSVSGLGAGEDDCASVPR